MIEIENDSVKEEIINIIKKNLTISIDSKIKNRYCEFTANEEVTVRLKFYGKIISSDSIKLNDKTKKRYY